MKAYRLFSLPCAAAMAVSMVSVIPAAASGVPSRTGSSSAQINLGAQEKMYEMTIFGKKTSWSQFEMFGDTQIDISIENVKFPEDSGYSVSDFNAGFYIEGSGSKEYAYAFESVDEEGKTSVLFNASAVAEKAKGESDKYIEQAGIYVSLPEKENAVSGEVTFDLSYTMHEQEIGTVAGSNVNAVTSSKTVTLEVFEDENTGELFASASDVILNTGTAGADWTTFTDFGYAKVESQLTDIKTADGTELSPELFYLQYYIMGNISWSWQSETGWYDENGKTEFIADTNALAAASKVDGSELVAQYGVQVRTDELPEGLKVGDKLTAEFSYKIYNSAYPNTYEDDNDTLKEPGYLPLDVKVQESYEDWGGQGFTHLKYFHHITPGCGVKVTVKYDLLDGYDSALIRPAVAKEWIPLYSHSQEDIEDRNYLAGIDLVSENDAETYKGTALMQDDGFFRIVDKNSKELTFEITAEGIDEICTDILPGLLSGEWGGLIYQVYGANISEVSYEEIVNQGSCTCEKDCAECSLPEYDAKVYYTSNNDAYLDNSSSVKIKGNGSYSIGIRPRIDVNEETGEEGTLIEADLSDPKVLVIDVPGIYEKGENGSKLVSDFAMSLDRITVDGKNISFDLAKVKAGHLEPDTDNYRLEIYNVYGDTAEDPAFDLAAFKGNDVHIFFTVTGAGDCDCKHTPIEPDKPDIQQVLLGDANDDGAFDIKDIIRVQKKINGDDVTINETAANVVSDNEINIKDVIRMQKMLNGDKQ